MSQKSERQKKLKKIFKNGGIYSFAIILWFLLPFSLSFYSWRQHGLRYIIEIYPAIALIAALGFDFLVSKITKSELKKFSYFVPIFIYLFIVLWQIKPYYLDYFNELVGGVNNVYEKNNYSFIRNNFLILMNMDLNFIGGYYEVFNYCNFILF